MPLLSGVPAVDKIIAFAKHVAVFPCRPDKKPFTEHGFKDASQDETQIRAWWGEHPDALVGVPTGTASALIAIDYDPAKRTAETDEWIETHSNELLSARVHSTMRGGKHYLFRQPKDVKYRSGSDLVLAGKRRPGIDLRSDGGYIIWWALHGGNVTNQVAPPLPAGLIDERKARGAAETATSSSTGSASWLKTRERLSDAMVYIDPTPRDTWRDVGMAIHLETGGADHGFDLWHAWSAGDLNGEGIDSYTGIDDCREQWASYRHDTQNPVRLGTIFHHAKLAGYQPRNAPLAVLEPETRPLLLVSGSTENIAQALPEYDVVAIDATLVHSLAGRRVDVWPQHNAYGYHKATQLVLKLGVLNADRVRIVRPTGGDYLPGWHPSDAQAAGFDLAAIRDQSATEIIVPRETVNDRKMTWEAMELTIASNHSPHANIDNAVRVLEYVKFGVWFDPFLTKTIYSHNGSGEREFGDFELAALTRWFQHDIRIRGMGKIAVNDAVKVYAHNHPRNCCLDWLLALKWDGDNRLARFMSDGLGTLDTEYYRAVGRCFFMGMVLRVIQPGSEVKAMPVLEGPENAKKTRALQTIGGRFYAAANEKILDKDFLQLFPGKMLIDISEMHSFSKAEVARIKSVISTPSDRYRESYAQYAMDHPRQCVFAGTTNRDDWNTSDTGASRFWPVACGLIDIEWITANREQLFAEAVARIQREECHWDVPEDEAREMVDDRRARDPWENAILYWCKTREHIHIDDIIGECLSIEMNKRDNSVAARVRSILRANGYIRVSVRERGTVIKAYRKAAVATLVDTVIDDTNDPF